MAIARLAVDSAVRLVLAPQPADRQRCSSSALSRWAFGLRFASSHPRPDAPRLRLRIQDFAAADRARCIQHSRAYPAAAAGSRVRLRPSAASYRLRSRKTGCTPQAPRRDRVQQRPQRTAWLSCRSPVAALIHLQIASRLYRQRIPGEFTSGSDRNGMEGVHGQTVVGPVGGFH